MRRVRLTEGQLHNVIRESVNNILNEISKDKKMMCLKKARALGRKDQASNFANGLIGDLNPEYEYDDEYDDGKFFYDPEGLSLAGHRANNEYHNYHEDLPNGERDSCGRNDYSPMEDNEDPSYIFDWDRKSDPRYRKAKSELDRLNNLRYK